MPSDIVLIGPVRAGKSTLAALLAQQLGLPQVSLDVLRWKYYPEIGFDESHAREIRQQDGFLAMMYYRSLFDTYAVERMLAEHTRCVFDFGAGIYESDEQFRRVRKALAEYPNVVLVLPSSDLDKSLQILTARDEHPPGDLHFNILAHLLKHHTYYDLAKLTIYTNGKSPQETCAEILARIGVP